MHIKTILSTILLEMMVLLPYKHTTPRAIYQAPTIKEAKQV